MGKPIAVRVTATPAGKKKPAVGFMVFDTDTFEYQGFVAGEEADVYARFDCGISGFHEPVEVTAAEWGRLNEDG